MPFPVPLANLETAVLDACASEEEWPAQVVAAVYAAIDYAVDHPEVVGTFALQIESGGEQIGVYEKFIGHLAGFLKGNAPVDKRLPGSTDEALIAGVVGLVGDHLRIGRVDRLEELRPDLVLLTLLPYLGFAEAQRWANSRAG